MKGPTPLVMFSGILNATRYAMFLVKWFITIHPKALRDHRLQQDNDPKHRSKIIASFFDR